ncbi:MAG: SRPBCC domain-containing protein [Bacteroidia bacterium]|nr:SRPBCC domain-containing protein [Bacteroidia bacterium]
MENRNTNFEFNFTTKAAPAEVFMFLKNPLNWWMGVYGESIEGKSEVVNDEFSFRAGNGAHYSLQRLVELTTNRKIVWEVTDSKLSFLDNTGEWIGTSFSFMIEQKEGLTSITFTHHGLVPEIECYTSCSGGWTQYLTKLQSHFN